jgi:asparagine synthase (glutamine-hydrolysing)
LGDDDPCDELLGLLPTGFREWEPFCQAQYLETTQLLPGYILSSQGDRVAMAHSVEGRFPFLDYRLAEFAAGIPVGWKMRGLNEKDILKRISREIVPASIRKRTKQPYRAPDAKSFFGDAGGLDYVMEMLSPQKLAVNGIFHPPAVEKLVEKCRKGQAIGTKDNMALVGILSTQLVIEQFINQVGPMSIAENASTEMQTAVVAAP